MGVTQYLMRTKVGPLLLAADEKGLWSVSGLGRGMPGGTTFDRTTPAGRMLNRAICQLEEYFDGTRKIFDLPLHGQGSDFQKRVWKELLAIPYGQTVSYGEIARKINNPQAARAVGSANGKNPFGIIVPCHRVIAADGSLGGYSGGLTLKKKLLEHEFCVGAEG